jgi:hypothetical protein
MPAGNAAASANTALVETEQIEHDGKPAWADYGG